MSIKQIKKKKTHKEMMLHRLKIIQGHVKAVEKMLQEDKYCIQILHQSMAVQKALKTFDMSLMEEHLKTCAILQVKSGQEEKMIEDLIGIYKFK